MRRDLERLFLRYRHKGDVRALERVFDRTARDLLVLGQHLVRDPNDAEDLLQSTFVTAIDRASSYDQRRPLRPWLAGILAGKAANMIRHRRTRSGDRSLTAASLDAEEGRPNDPSLAAESAELQGALRLALDRVGGNYREVLEAYLCDGRDAAEIAARLERSPGTVRTQIYRGLRALRAHLPRGSALALLGAPRGLQHVRQAVRQHAGLAASPVAGAGAGLVSLSMGGLLVGQKSLLTGAALVAAGLGLWVSGDADELAIESTSISAALRDRTSIELEQDSLAAFASGEARSPVQESGLEREPEAAGGPAGRALVRVRLLGVEDAKRAGIGVMADSLLAEPDPSLPKLDLDARDLLAVASRIQQLPPFDVERAQLGQVESSAGQPIAGSILNSRYTYLSRQRVDSAPGSRAGFEFESVALQADGSFELELTPDIRAGRLRFQVRAGGEFYFEAQGTVEFPEHTEGRLDAGEDVVLELELSPTPAAILDGRLTSASGSDVMPEAATLQVIAALSELDEVHVQPLSGVLLSPGQGGYQLAGERGWQIVSQTTAARLALFRPGADEPLATTTPDWNGTFELRVPEDGPFVLVALKTGHPVLSQPVDLGLLERVELEATIESAQELEVRGFVEDSGLFAEGGLELELSRHLSAQDHPFRWEREELCWTAGQVVRSRVSARTEAEGHFRIAGASAGAHRLGFAPSNVLSLFAARALDAAGVDLPVPASDVQLVLPASLIQLRVCSPEGQLFDEGAFRWTLTAVERESGRELGATSRDASEDVLLLSPVGLELELRASADGFELEGWCGPAPAVGELRELRLIARAVEAPVADE